MAATGPRAGFKHLSMIADKQSGVPADVLKTIRAGQPIPDARFAALSALTTAW